MSSHHIVTEDQEPALIIVDFDSTAIAQLNQLLEWSPRVVVHGKDLEAIANMGIKIDVLFTDGQPDLPQDHILVLPLIGNFLDTALAYLEDKGCREVNILGNGTDPDVLLQWIGRVNVTLLCNGRRLFAVKSGFRKWKTKGEVVYVHDNRVVSSANGLIQRDANHYLTAEDGFYTIHFTEPYGIVGEYL